jgi:uncharacterized repeat protein (TIGR02543 family)
VRFTRGNLDSSASGTVVTVGSTTYTYSSLGSSGQQIWVNSGTTYTYNDPVTGSTGKRFDLTSVSGPASPITVTGTVTPTYQIQYQLTINTNAGTVSPASGEWYNAGTTVTPILATAPSVVPGERYVFNGWTGSGTGSYTGTNNPATVTMNGAIIETASWTHQYQVSFAVSPTGSGSTTPTGSSQWVGASQAITATANSGYRFSTWTVTGPVTINNPSSASATATISGSGGTITANFVIDTTQTLILRPMGVGNYNGLSRSGSGGANWDRVDEAAADSDTTYVYYDSSSSGYIRDTYATQDASATGTINSVTVYIVCRSYNVGGTAYARTVLRSGSNNYAGTDITLISSYSTYSTTYNSNPEGGSWSWSAINSLQCGVDLRRTSGGGEIRCTQVYIVVNYTP